VTEGGSRLSRWSRMKADARRTRGMRFAVPEDAPDPVAEATLPATGANEGTRPDQERTVETAPAAEAGGGDALPLATTEEELGLPEVDSLDAGSDYTPFMSDKVSDAIRNRALRKLWRSDPVLACLDGLNDYDEDYTDAAMVVAGMKSDYVVGRGMVDYEAEEAKKRATEEAEEANAVASADGEEVADEPNQASEPSEGSESDPAVLQADDQAEDIAGTPCNEKENDGFEVAHSVQPRRDAVSVS